MSSGEGSAATYRDAFCRLVNDLIRARGFGSVVDIGCGDFAVGSAIAPNCERYRAFDVSSVIIRRNRDAFGHLANVSFQEANIIEGPVGGADLVFIRQVLQHLSNDQIERALRNSEASAARCVLIADEVSARPDMTPNIDLGQQRVGTRANFGSGLMIDRPPFDRAVNVLAEIPGNYGNHLRVVELVRGTGSG